MKSLKVNAPKITILFSFILMLFATACSQSQATNDKTSTNAKAANIDIHATVIAGKAELVRQYIKAGGDIDKKEPMSSSTPLITAITFDKPEIAKILIDAKADLAIKNKDGSTALHVAAFFGRIKMVQMLMDAKADKTIKNNMGATPRQTVLGEFAQMKPFYEMISQQLKPMGFVLDMDKLQKARPVVATMLQ